MVEITRKIALKARGKEEVREYLEVVKEYYMNEHSILYLKNILNLTDLECENFSVLESLDSIMEVFSIESQLNNVLLTLETEPCFPKLVSGDKSLFEQLILSLIIYLAKNSSDSEMRVEAKLKCPSVAGFILSFGLETRKIQRQSQDELREIFMKDYRTTILSCQYGIRVHNCSLILSLLKGTIDVQTPDADSVRLSIEIPFDSPVAMKEESEYWSVKLLKRRKINEYTTQWLAELLPKAEKKAKVMAVSSPNPQLVRKLDLNRVNQQSNPLRSQNMDKKKLIDRLLREQVLGKHKSEARILLESHRGNPV